MALPEHASYEAVADGGPIFSLEEQEERARQNVVLQNAFTYICKDPPLVKIPRLAIVEGLRMLAEEIRGDEKSMVDFWTYQEEHIGDPDYGFLGEIHPGLNVTGWRVMMALIDPLQYGRDIIAMSGPYQPTRKT